MHALITATLHTSGQFAVRLVLLLLIGLVAISVALRHRHAARRLRRRGDHQVAAAGADPQDAEVIESKLEAIGFGFLVPVFFINTGVTFDLDVPGEQPDRRCSLLPVFLILLLIVRGLPGLLSAPIGALPAPTSGPSCCSAPPGCRSSWRSPTIGVDSGDLQAGTASALVGAGMLSVLLFPLLALGQHRQGPDGGTAKPPDVDADHRRRGLSGRTGRQPGTVDGVTDAVVDRRRPSPRHPARTRRSAPRWPTRPGCRRSCSDGGSSR